MDYDTTLSSSPLLFPPLLGSQALYSHLLCLFFDDPVPLYEEHFY